MPVHGHPTVRKRGTLKLVREPRTPLPSPSPNSHPRDVPNYSRGRRGRELDLNNCPAVGWLVGGTGGNMTDHYTQWCIRNNCCHGHCPHHCEHPQPIAVVMNGETDVTLICGRCWCKNGEVSPMVPCVPTTCGE